MQQQLLDKFILRRWLVGIDHRVALGDVGQGRRVRAVREIMRIMLPIEVRAVALLNVVSVLVMILGLHEPSVTGMRDASPHENHNTVARA